VGNTERILDLLAQLNARGTFYVLGWVARKHPTLVKTICDRGHEIASHGFGHELIYNQTALEFREDIRSARILLQDLSGQPVIGYRAPSYTIVHRTLWALHILAEEGYRYDSSVFPIPRQRYGMPWAPRWPHRIDLGDTGSIAEFPLPTVRIWPVNFPATGGAYLRLLPEEYQIRAVGHMLRKHLAFVINVHPWELDPDQPRFRVPRRTQWKHYHNLHVAGSRLSKLLSLSQFRSQGEVLVNLGLL
jgi:polysaccharide deacetylase family protein (PEP-CTERM system associated)